MVSKEQLERLYIKEHLSAKSVGKILGYSGVTIRKFLLQCGIPIRCHSERSKNGKYLHEGYVVIRLKPDDPFYPMSSKTNSPYNYGYVSEHRLVMAQHLSRFLRPWELVHHKNGVRNDNRLENLELIPSPEKHLAITNMQQRIKWLEQRVTQLEAELVLLKTQQPLKIEQ